MEVILILGGLIFLFGFAFIMFEKPFIPVAFLIFMMIYVFNIRIPGPLDARGLLLILLFVRLILLDRENLSLVTGILFKNPFFYLVLIFCLSIFIVTYSYEGSLKLSLKEQILGIISLIMGFSIFSNKRGRSAFTLGLIAAGLVSVFDLVFHYIIGGVIEEKFTMYRLLDLITLTPFEYQWGTNHNFPGYLAGTAFIFVYLNYFRKNWKKIYCIPLMLVLGAGVLLSTSRSTLLSVIVVMIYISFSHGNLSLNFKKIVFSMIAVIIVYISLYFAYNIFLKSSATADSLISKAYARLYEDPLKYVGGGTKKFDAYLGTAQEDNLTFRLEKARIDIDKFFSQEFFTQLFGYGKGGYKYIGQKIFQDYDNAYILGAHNGYIVILVETGIVGLIIFLLVSIGLITKSVKINKWSPIDVPLFYFFLMLMIYVTFQNSELTSSLSFLLIGGMIANVTTFDSTVTESEMENFTETAEPNLVRDIT
jgi:hypothetical protein